MSNKKQSESYTYAKAGVSIDAGNALVRAIGPIVKSTMRPGADGEIGGFGGFFDLKAAGYKDPILVAGNDGVGTKLKLAIENNKHDTVGIDLVAMCVNDLIVQGAEPLFFLDYFATGKLENGVAERVISGIADGCKQAGCALIGGETAEMPGMYSDNDYDLAGFCVGAVERGRQITGKAVSPGHTLIGLASSGIHSNGYSLVRKLAKDKNWKLHSPTAFNPYELLVDTLMKPTTIYVDTILPLVRESLIDGIAHITGGGLLENIPRVMPENCHAVIDVNNWKQPGLMSFLQTEGNIAPEEMARTFNCGVGMIIAVSPQHHEKVLQRLNSGNHYAFIAGFVEDGKRGCTIKGSGNSWNSASEWKVSHLA